MSKATITFDKFLEIQGQLEIKFGKVVEAERIPKSDKLLKLTVNFTSPLDKEDVIKTVVTNLGSRFEPEHFVSKVIPFITNLEPTKMMGVVSEAMIMVASDDEKNGTSLESVVGFNLL